MTDQKTSIGRVVAGVVDVQQTMALHFDSLCKGMEALKIEHKSGIETLRDEIRRSDDRVQAQFAEMNSFHNKEMERLHQIIQILITRDSAPIHAMLPPQIPHNPQALMQLQQQQQQAALQQALLLRQMEMQQMQHAQAAQPNQAMTNLINAANNAGSKPVVPAVPVPTFSVPPPQFKPQVPIGQTQQISAIPKNFQQPTPPTVAQPKPAVQTSVPATVITPTPPVAEKPKPVTTPATPQFSFGSSLLGKKTEAAPVVIPPASAPATNHDDEEEDNNEEYESEAVFAPVIPLPDLVEVKTGEEDEEIVFKNRSKLYIFSNETQEWKERGTGELKVLLNKKTKNYRVVMRRDQVTISEEPLPSKNGNEEELCWNIQVLKVCANFPIVKSMSIQPMRANEKAYTWFCEDFSEEEPAHVKLSARFANVDIATEFKNLFEKAIAAHKGNATIDKEIKPAEVKKEVKKEIKEEVVIPPNNKENGFGDKFKLKAGDWECTGCYVTNKAEQTVCGCCGANKDGTSEPKNIFSKPSILQPAPGTPKVSFGFGASATPKENSTPAAAFGASLNGSPSTANSSVFGGGTPKSSIFGGGSTGTPNAAPTFSFNAKPAAAATTTATPTFNFNKPAATSSQGNSLFGGGVKTDSPSFLFNKPSESTAQKPLFAFGNKPASTSSPAPSVGEKNTDTPKNVFGSFGGGETFASLAAKAKETTTSIFDSANAERAQQELASQKKTSVFANKIDAAKPAAGEQQDGDEEGGDVEYEPEVEFAPVVPLPELVEVKTGEEDEEVVFTARCKLYKYYADLQENKERGVGDIKVLKSQDNKYRIVMRREQVHKLCANFRIEKSMKLNPKANLPQVLTFMCQDYSEDATTPDPAIFTAKFKDEEIAKSFKQAVLDAQSAM